VTRPVDPVDVFFMIFYFFTNKIDDSTVYYTEKSILLLFVEKNHWKGLHLTMDQANKAIPKEYVVYNFDLRDQKIDCLFRGDRIPKHYREYKRLLRIRDKDRNVVTIIISI
jgi:hypothetical protein